ncbi:acyl-CoA dehydrogenase family protein [Nocardia miyunensis]|uniref:acyl-CoA dehydrogenase family protein n=1 Tax=Nocardia miyunensis TaxID=282684 RepID=UPI001FE0C088|nr:acyl-CoA dehydrogenase family protein [Nocardia miyunensis]
MEGHPPRMNALTFTDEQEQLRDTVRAFLAKASPEAEVRRMMETGPGFDAAVWRQLAAQLGLPGLHIPEEYGGAGYGWAELAVVLEEMGAALLCAPFLATVLAASALLASGDPEARHDLLPGIAEGTVTATVAFADTQGRWDDTDSAEAQLGADGWRLTGVKGFVLDGATAGLLLVTARTGAATGDGDRVGAQRSLFAVAADAPGLTRTPLPVMDLTRRQAELVLQNTPARLVGAEGGADAVLEHVLQLAAIALACEGVGGIRTVLGQATTYACQRFQFGRPIGSFQAVKHRCADMLVALETAKSAAYYAAATIGAAPTIGDAGLALAASLAKAWVGDAFVRAAEDNIQLHGGIGFTWEHPAHLYLKRAKSAQLMFGAPARHRDLIARHFAL